MSNTLVIISGEKHRGGEARVQVPGGDHQPPTDPLPGDQEEHRCSTVSAQLNSIVKYSYIPNNYTDVWMIDTRCYLYTSLVFIYHPFSGTLLKKIDVPRLTSCYQVELTLSTGREPPS